MKYTSVQLEDSLHVKELYTIHYFEYMSNFSFAGESHDFWEFLYVDKGEVNVTADQTEKLLHKGEVIFHKPGEFHSVTATGVSAPNLVVVSFSSSSPIMQFFNGKILSVDALERNLLAEIIVEARNCFSCRLDDPYLTHMTLKIPDALGAGQLLRMHLEHFLLHLIRRYSNPLTSKKESLQMLSKSTKIRSDSEAFQRIVEYLEANLNGHVTIDQICKDNLIGRSQLQKIFREKTNQGVIEYFSGMKIETAKEMIRTNRMNFTQIAEQLGYTSIHYFSRQFKKITGMTPSEYAYSVKAAASGAFPDTRDEDSANLLSDTTGN